GRGTGLGMAMIYGIVKQHKGHIHIYSEVGTGTTVKIYLPVTRPSVVSSGEPRRETIPGKGNETILVVEDDVSIGRATRRALENYGYTVISASDGEEALETVSRCGSSKIDLIITDLVMPKLGGRQLYEALRSAGCDIKIMFASGYSKRDIEECAVLDTKIPFLHKPWTLAELLSRVREALDQEVSGNGMAKAAHKKPESGRKFSYLRRSVPPLTVSAWS
ncbi:MAG: response regulator, partial [Gemmatimonadota bacterium]